MRIGVCFKIVPDYETLLDEEWKKPAELDFTYAKKMYGCFDEPALEMALRIADSLKAAGEEAETVAVTCGAPEGTVSDSLLRALFAAGFSDVVLLPASDSFSPALTAKSLASYFSANPADLILTGRMVGPGDSGMVPFYLAKELNLPLYPEMVSAKYETEKLQITCKEQNLLCVYTPDSPALGTVGDAEAAYLRLFPLKARMDAKKRVFSQWDGMPAEYAEDVSLFCEEKPEGACRFLEAADAADGARKLIEILKGGAEG